MTETNAGNRPLKVCLISHSDTIGGASMVTYRLMHALRQEGVDARMIVYAKTTDSPEVVCLGSRNMRGIKFMLERGRIALSNGFSRENLFKVSIANVGQRVADHPWVREADVICLAWINQGLLSINGIRALGRLGKPIVWTMHDMWCLTGICHHAFECGNYRQQCGNCRFLGVGGAHDLSNSVWRKKKKLYDEVPVTFVAVSNWLAGCARASSLLGDSDVRVIPNAFPVNTFSTKAKKPSAMLPFSSDEQLIVMGAARLDDPIKGFSYAIDALNILFDNRPDIARSARAVFFGNLRDRSLLDRLRFPYVYLQRINDTGVLSDLYASAKVVLSTSLYETLPGTLIEGQAAGCLPVTFGHGGQADIVTHLKDGYIAEYLDAESVAKGIIWALNRRVDREALHESVRERFAASKIARRYIDLFNELLDARKSGRDGVLERVKRRTAGAEREQKGASDRSV